MCGIFGFLSPQYRFNTELIDRILTKCTSPILNRGPDGVGRFTDVAKGLGVSHTRLSIIDLTSLGSQPMTSLDNRYCITFNGEIYNYKSIRAHISSVYPSIKYRSHSDTEVLLTAIQLLGLQKLLICV